MRKEASMHNIFYTVYSNIIYDSILCSEHLSIIFKLVHRIQLSSFMHILPLRNQYYCAVVYRLIIYIAIFCHGTSLKKPIWPRGDSNQRHRYQ